MQVFWKVSLLSWKEKLKHLFPLKSNSWIVVSSQCSHWALTVIELELCFMESAVKVNYFMSTQFLGKCSEGLVLVTRSFCLWWKQTHLPVSTQNYSCRESDAIRAACDCVMCANSRRIIIPVCVPQDAFRSRCIVVCECECVPPPLPRSPSSQASAQSC